MFRFQFCSAVLKDSGKAAVVSAGVAGGLTLATAVAKYWAASSSNGLRLTGTYLGKFMGPALILTALGYQVNITFLLREKTLIGCLCSAFFQGLLICWIFTLLLIIML